jgi:hypothetical protein
MRGTHTKSSSFCRLPFLSELFIFWQGVIACERCRHPSANFAFGYFLPGDYASDEGGDLKHRRAENGLKPMCDLGGDGFTWIMGRIRN